MNRNPIRVLLLCLLVLPGACTLPLPGNSPAAQTHTYLLEWTPTGPARMPPASAPSLLLAPVRATAAYAGSDMLYTDGSHELKSFAWHRWADSPARLLEPLLLDATEHSGLFRHVVPAGTRALTDLRLDTELLRLRQVFAGGKCRVELVLRIDLVQVDSGRPRGGRRLDYSEACTQPTPAGGAITANHLVGRFLDGLEKSLRELMQAGKG